MEFGFRSKKLWLASCCLILGACGSGVEHQDLHDFMEKARSQPVGEIEPLPTFNPYETFKYSAMALRSPFEKPVIVDGESQSEGVSAVEPDQNRKKEYLEQFNFSAFSLVGAIARDGVLWSLVEDGEGDVHRVTVGNYMGKNHGKIVSNVESKVDVIEIVPDGKGGWVERPRTLTLRENN